MGKANFEPPPPHAHDIKIIIIIIITNLCSAQSARCPSDCRRRTDHTRAMHCGNYSLSVPESSPWNGHHSTVSAEQPGSCGCCSGRRTRSGLNLRPPEIPPATPALCEYRRLPERNRTLSHNTQTWPLQTLKVSGRTAAHANPSIPGGGLKDPTRCFKKYFSATKLTAHITQETQLSLTNRASICANKCISVADLLKQAAAHSEFGRNF